MTDNIDSMVDGIISKLSNNELSVINVPVEFSRNPKLISYERSAGLRTTGKRGYDIIRDSFFAEDILIFQNRTGQEQRRTKWYFFKSFNDYYHFLCGDIYENACYSFLDLDRETISRYKIDKTRFFKEKAFIKTTIDNYTLEKLCPDVNIQALDDIRYNICKEYNAEIFSVSQTWEDSGNNFFKYDCQEFRFFFDFVFFLKGDLSNAELISCDGLANLSKMYNINFFGAKLISSLCTKFGINYKKYDVEPELFRSFECTGANEIETIDILERKISFTDEDEVGHGSKDRIHYISDLHLLHNAERNGAKSQEDFIHTARKAAEAIARQAGKLVLIGGDVTSDFCLFFHFISHLSKVKKTNTDVVFILGNHELWSFQDKSFYETVSIYRSIITSMGMYLLQNDLLYIETQGNISIGQRKIHIISYGELEKLADNHISALLRNASCVLLGGLGFSGYNQEFNADDGVYGKAVSRSEEIKETRRFEALYNRMKTILPPNNTIILTHMPKEDWCRKKEYDKYFIYFSGHTHKNIFYDDGITRVYSDNQLGYSSKGISLKYFIFDYTYDYFYDYKDGIYSITREQYQEFFRGKNIQMTFNRKIYALYMLKKHSYYCFIHESATGILTLLHGGSMKKLQHNDITYYFNNMDAAVSKIEEPLAKYTKMQEEISDSVKKLGGAGNIHGCIIDIDFYNHIYLNPIDGKITCYWASDVINKIVYPSLPALLQNRNPQLFLNYKKLLNSGAENLFSHYEETDLIHAPQLVLETDIYKVSREVSKMQRIKKQVLNIWPENMNQKETTSSFLLKDDN